VSYEEVVVVTEGARWTPADPVSVGVAEETS
jgi:hypothetical protein